MEPLEAAEAIAFLRARVEVDASSGCWNWTRAKHAFGYGIFMRNGRAGSAHRLALELRLGRPIGAGLSALHGCDNPSCANGEHLREGSQAENVRDRDRRGRQVTPRGEAHPQHKLTEEDVLEIRAALAAGELQREIAERYGVRRQAISKIKRGQRWGHV